MHMAEVPGCDWGQLPVQTEDGRQAHSLLEPSQQVAAYLYQ